MFYVNVGSIKYDGVEINVYNDLNEPLFLLKDVAKLTGYRTDSSNKLLEFCEEDEHLQGNIFRAGQKRKVTFVTEMGLYNILSQMRTQQARKWRRVVHQELIDLRLKKSKNISEQFDEWEQMGENIYFDETTGELMEFRTIAGGDVEVRKYEG